jgi:membrane protein
MKYISQNRIIMTFKKISSFIFIFIDSFKELYYQGYAYRASALAFTTALTFVPLMSISFYFFGKFTYFDRLQFILQEYIFKILIPSFGQDALIYLNQFITQGSKLPLISILFLIVTILLLIITIKNSFSSIQKSERIKNKSYYFYYSVIVILIPLVIGMSNVLTAFAFFLMKNNIFENNLYIVVSVINFIIPFIINACVLTLLYSTTLNIWEGAMLGGFVASLLLEIAKILFIVYIHAFNYYQIIYGVLAAIPIFLVWLYIFWFILLYGGFVAHQYWVTFSKEIK